MFDSSTQASSLMIQTARRGRHDAFLKRSFSSWLVDTSVERKTELKNTQPHIPDWYATATDRQKAQLKSLLEVRFTSQNRLDKHLRELQTAEAFAQPLLEVALNSAGFTLPVNNVYPTFTPNEINAFLKIKMPPRNFAYKRWRMNLIRSPPHCGSGVICPSRADL